jgi:hypothetical protein
MACAMFTDRWTQLESPYLKDQLFDTESSTSTGPYIVVESGKDQLLTAGDYAFHQGTVIERGQFATKLPGRAFLGKIDPRQPFIFEVRDRVCAIRAGAFLNPDDPQIQYGGTWFDWEWVRENSDPDARFWPHYHREMDFASTAESREGTRDRRVDRFLQHEHITRRPIRIAKPFLTQLSEVRIRATPAQIRVGPFVRYADHQCAVVWLETVTPCMVRARYRKSGGTTDAMQYASTVRVGGRYFAAIEITGLRENTFYNYTLDLVPLPAVRPIPGAADLAKAFPTLTLGVTESMTQQCQIASFNNTRWLSFRTLRERYDKQALRFATGSCRWYPGDTHGGKEFGPDMLEGLGGWVRMTNNEQWPQFLFLGGDQIYSDEIGDNHGKMIISGRFAARRPGPADPARSPRDKLIDGAWAGRFAHRLHPNTLPGDKPLQQIEGSLKKLDDIHKHYPDIQGIYTQYPDKDPEKQLRARYETFRTKRQVGGAKGEADDERRAREALNQLSTVKSLEIQAEPYRALLAHWKADRDRTETANPMRRRFLFYNFLLWKIPDVEEQLPIVADSRATRRGYSVARKQNARGQPSADGGNHAADFAEYAYLYERAWTSGRNVRALLANVPTFLMFDDHEATDDWNMDATWVRMLNNPKDAFGMWPKALTDALAAYWVYQGWCNKAPSQWKSTDPRVQALADAARDGTDALPRLRKVIHGACFERPKGNKAEAYQTGLGLDWHYRLPFDPPFLVPDCRTRRRMVPSDEQMREINHDVPDKTPKSQTIDNLQLDWIRSHLEAWRGGPVVFIATSTPLLLQKKVTGFMKVPQIAAGAWARGADVLSFFAALFETKKTVVSGSTMLDRVFRTAKDLEHMIRDASWRDLWSMVDRLRALRSPVKTIVLVSGDVHHNYAMTANLPGGGRPTPELLQITCSGLQTTIRKDWQKSLAEKASSQPFNVGRYRLVPGFMAKAGTDSPDLVLYENAAAIVDVNIGAEVDVAVTYLAGKDRHVFRYTSGPAYMLNGVPAIYERQRQRGPAVAGAR